MSEVQQDVVDMATMIEKAVNNAVLKIVPKAVSVVVHDMGFRPKPIDDLEWLRMEDHCEKYKVSRSSVFANVKRKRIQKKRVAGGTYYRPVIQNID